MSVEYDYEELREWNKVVVEVTTSWQRISEFVPENISENADKKALQNEVVRQIANAIVSRWLYPKNEVRTTSIMDLNKLYLPVHLMPELMGEFEAVLVKKAYDKIRPCAKILYECKLIQKKQVGREVHYQPTEELLNYCVDCSQKLKEIM